jgi:hypothetical protein
MRRATPAAAAAARRRTTGVGSFQSLVFTGTLYPGYAGALPVTVNVTQNTTALPPSVTLSFNNVPTGNNEWVLIDVEGYASPSGAGSRSDLGQLGGLISVGALPGAITVDGGSTLRLQLALAAMGDGLISTYDLVNETNLDSDLGLGGRFKIGHPWAVQIRPVATVLPGRSVTGALVGCGGD